MHQFPDSFGHHPFGGSSYHSYPSMSSPQSSSFTRYSPNRLHEYCAPTQTIRSPKAPKIDNLTTHAQTPCPVSHAATPEVHIAEPKTSASSANLSRLPLFETMKSDLKCYITNGKGLDRLQYELSWEEFVAFREEAKESVPGWEKLKYVITSSMST
jgi:hypothetical protein